MKTIEQQIQEKVDAFVADITQLAREAAIASIGAALGGSMGAAPPRGAQRAAPKAKAGKTTRRAASRRGGKRIRRSSEAVGETAEAIRSYVAANPNCSVTDIADALGSTSKELRLPILKLVADGKIRTTGQKRGMRYHPGRGGAVKKKVRRKKKTTRRTKAA